MVVRMWDLLKTVTLTLALVFLCQCAKINSESASAPPSESGTEVVITAPTAAVYVAPAEPLVNHLVGRD